MCFGPKNPRQYRDVIYKFSMNAKLHILNLHTQDGFSSSYGGRLERKSARYLATFAYIWAVISSVICVILFVFNIVAMEVLLSKLCRLM